MRPPTVGGRENESVPFSNVSRRLSGGMPNVTATLLPPCVYWPDLNRGPTGMKAASRLARGDEAPALPKAPLPNSHIDVCSQLNSIEPQLVRFHPACRTVMLQLDSVWCNFRTWGVGCTLAILSFLLHDSCLPIWNAVPQAWPVPLEFGVCIS